MPQDQITGSLCALLGAFQHLGANQSHVRAASPLPSIGHDGPAFVLSHHGHGSALCEHETAAAAALLKPRTAFCEHERDSLTCGCLRTPWMDPTHSQMRASCLHLQILAQLSQFRTLPDFDNYLALILANGEGQPIEVRCRAPAFQC